MIIIDVEVLMYILYAAYAITVLAPVLCLIAYIFRSKFVNVIAWVATILAMIASLVITFTDFGMLSVIIPSLCLFILFTKMGKSATGNRYLIVSMLSAIALLIVFFGAGKFVLEKYAFGYKIAPADHFQIFFVLYFNIVLGALVSLLLRRLPEKKIPLQSVNHTILLSVLVGIGAYATDLFFMETWSHMRRQALDISFVLFHVTSYLNIFTNLLCWALTGWIVNTLLCVQQKKAEKAKVI